MTYDFEPRATMLPKEWKRFLTIVFHTVCINGASIPVPIALLLNNDYGLSNTSSNILPEPIRSDSGPAKPDLNATRESLNLTAGEDAFGWTHFVTLGIQRTQSLFPGAVPVSIKTYSCDGFDYPRWHYLDCYTIAFSGPFSTSSVSIEGRWDQVKASMPHWDVPLHSAGSRSSLPVVPWPPFVTLEDAEGLARSMGHTQPYHAVTLEGVRGGGNSFSYKFSSREVQDWHFSFHDVTVGRVTNGTEGVSGS